MPAPWLAGKAQGCRASQYVRPNTVVTILLQQLQLLRRLISLSTTVADLGLFLCQLRLKKKGTRGAVPPDSQGQGLILPTLSSHVFPAAKARTHAHAQRQAVLPVKSAPDQLEANHDGTGCSRPDEMLPKQQCWTKMLAL